MQFIWNKWGIGNNLKCIEFYFLVNCSKKIFWFTPPTCCWWWCTSNCSKYQWMVPCNAVRFPFIGREACLSITLSLSAHKLPTEVCLLGFCTSYLLFHSLSLPFFLSFFHSFCVLSDSVQATGTTLNSLAHFFTLTLTIHSFIHSFFAFLLRRRKCCPSTLENTQTNGSIKPLYKDAIGKASVPVGNSLLSKRSNTNSSLCALGARQNLIFWIRRDHHTKTIPIFVIIFVFQTKINLDLILGLSRTNVCQLIELLHSIVESFIRLILFFCVCSIKICHALKINQCSTFFFQLKLIYFYYYCCCSMCMYHFK